MANEITYALVSSLIPNIREGALWYANHNFVMPRLVTSFTDRTGFTPRDVTAYSEGTQPVELAEDDDMSPAAFDRALLNQLTPKEYGRQNIITDRRTETDPEDIVADVMRDIGYSMGKHVELSLLNEFVNLTGGVYGSGGSRMSLDRLVSAKVRLEKAGIPGPYVTVLHPYQYLDLWADWTDMSQPAPLSIREMAMQNYSVTRVADFFVVVSSLVPTTAEANEVQTVDVSGSPTGGTYTLSFAEQETSDLAYNASAATVQAALEALPNIGSGNVSVSGSGGSFTVTFEGDLAGENVPTLVGDGSGLTGGTDPSIEVAVTTEGRNHAKGALFSRDAIAIDLRRPVRIEPERDASMRWTELNTTLVYATGSWRPERGVILKSDASTPLDGEIV